MRHSVLVLECALFFFVHEVNQTMTEYLKVVTRKKEGIGYFVK